MDESMIHIEVSQSPGCGPIPPSFADLVERFCLDIATIRSRLANVGCGRDWRASGRPDPRPWGAWDGSVRLWTSDVGVERFAPKSSTTISSPSRASVVVAGPKGDKPV